jgi:hypothetical protein
MTTSPGFAKIVTALPKHVTRPAAASLPRTMLLLARPGGRTACAVDSLGGATSAHTLNRRHARAITSALTSPPPQSTISTSIVCLVGDLFKARREPGCCTSASRSARATRRRGGGDHLEGDKGADRLDGAAGDDYANGGEGDDFLDGGTGFDIWGGRDGVDTCINGELNMACQLPPL